MTKKNQNYKAWDIREDEYPKNAAMQQKLEFLVNYGILAPSVHNSQPWIYRVKGNEIQIKMNPEVSLKVADPKNNWQFFAIGAFTENICQAARQFGLITRVNSSKNEVIITCSESNKTEILDLVSAIKKRASYKNKFKDEPIPRRVTDSLSHVELLQGVGHTLVQKGSNLEAISKIHLESSKHVATDTNFVVELAHWLRPNNTKKFDGMPGFITATPFVKSLVGSRVLKKKPALFASAASGDSILLKNTPSILVFNASSTSPQDYVSIGRYVERVWLEAIRLGLAAHPLSAIFHSSDSIQTVKDVLKLNTTPVFTMRVGYATSDKILHTPRKLTK